MAVPAGKFPIPGREVLGDQPLDEAGAFKTKAVESRRSTRNVLRPAAHGGETASSRPRGLGEKVRKRGDLQGHVVQESGKGGKLRLERP